MATHLITGHRGFIGSKLWNVTHDVIGVDVADGLNVLTCPLPETQIIFHMAAQTSVASSMIDPVHDSYNFNMVVRLVHEFPNARLIFPSSAAAEDPQSPYGFSKKICADYIERFHKNYVICVLPNVYGGGRGVVDIFKRNPDVTIYGDGNQVRDFVHVDDIVKALLMAREWPVGKYYLGSGIGVPIKALARKKNVRFEPALEGEIRESILKNTTPNWKPEIDVIKYIEQ